MQTKEQHQRALKYRFRSVKSSKAIVSWKSRITGFEGAGKPMPTEAAIEAVKLGEESCPLIDHWLTEA